MLIVLMHHPNEGPFQLGRVLQDQGHRLEMIRLWEDQAPPADLDEVEGVVVMGGPMNVEDAPTLPWMQAEMAFINQAHAVGKPIVGICLGAQLIAACLGGTVEAMPTPPGPEVGWHPVRLAFPGTMDPLFSGVPWNHMMFHMHGQQVTKLPPEGTPLAGSNATKLQAFRVGLTTYAFQYHFEWDRQGLALAVQDGLVARTGASAAAIMAEAEQHYDAYRRVGDRLCEHIALYLMPVPQFARV